MVTVVCNQFGTDCYYTTSSRWQRWGRWLLLAVVILAFVVAILMAGAAMSRRRARKGHPPVYGFAWSVPNPYKHHQSRMEQRGNPQQQYTPNNSDGRAMIDPESHIQYPQPAYYPNNGSYKGASPVFEEHSEYRGRYEREYYPPPATPPTK